MASKSRSDTHESSARINGIEQRLNDQRDETVRRFDQIEVRMDNHHKEMMENVKEIFTTVNTIKSTCSACTKEIQINTQRLDNLDNPKDGVISEMQQEVSSLKTRVGIYIAIGGSVVVGIIEVLRFFFK